jgi:C4-dicarboxylate-specific signal transduction histidine kinase
MACTCWTGCTSGIRNSEGTFRQREHLARLGTLSANLAHELNNPAAAAVRATGQLRERVAGMRHKLG